MLPTLRGWRAFLRTRGSLTQATELPIERRLTRHWRKLFVLKPRVDWLKLFVEGDIPGGPVNNIAEALADPQVQFRNMVVEIDHPTAGMYKTAGNPIKMGEQESFGPPPTLGQHTEQVLSKLLNYSPDEIQSLREAGAI